ncbi:MAG: HPF/RaiA family ribosome-associated protein [Saprospiraceae bacterium]
MNITIQTVGFKESNHLTKFVNDKVEKLFHQHPETIRVDITLKEGAKNNPTNQWCSLYLSHSGENQFVKHKSASYEESILLCVETMEKILRRRKTKKVNQRNDHK